MNLKRLGLACVWLAGMSECAFALDAEMDPAPLIPMRVGEYQHFLVTLSNAKAACEGTVKFKDLAAGLSAEPAELEFKLAPGESRTLAFKISNSAWGEPALVRPEITVKGAEALNFPELFKTEIMRDQKILDKKPLDEQGLLF